MSLPRMSLHIGDYRKDTSHLDAAQHGAYLMLLMHYWSTGGLPNDDAQLSRIACMTPPQWRKAKPILQALFRDGWHHKRVEQEMEEANKKYEKLSGAGLRGADARWGRKGTANANANGPPNGLAIGDDTNDAIATAMANGCQPITDNQDSPSLRSGENARARARADPRFDEFWKLYPHKVGKIDAAKAFSRVLKSGQIAFEQLMVGLRGYVAKTDDRPWCNPATWLNGGRWDDQPAQQGGRQHGVRTDGKSVLAAIERLEQQLAGDADREGGEDDFLSLPAR